MDQRELSLLPAMKTQKMTMQIVAIKITLPCRQILCVIALIMPLQCRYDFLS